MGLIFLCSLEVGVGGGINERRDAPILVHRQAWTLCCCRVIQTPPNTCSSRCLETEGRPRGREGAGAARDPSGGGLGPEGEGAGGARGAVARALSMKWAAGSEDLEQIPGPLRISEVAVKEGLDEPPDPGPRPSPP